MPVQDKLSCKTDGARVKAVRALLATAAAFVALAPCGFVVRAQTGTQAAPAADGKAAAQPGENKAGEGKAAGGEAVRERRVTAKAAGENEDAASPVAVAEAATTAADEGAEIEALRARSESEKDEAERARLRRELAARLIDANRGAEAVTLLRAMAAEERFDPPHFYNAGNALARLGESQAAAEAYRKAIGQRRGNYSRAQHNLGVVLIRLGRWDEAEEALRAALRLESQAYPEASYNLGRLHALRGEAGLAMAEWGRALKTKPDHTDACVALARALAEEGDRERALAVLDAFAQRLSRRGLAAPREVTVARGEIVAAANVEAVGRSGREAGGDYRPSDARAPAVPRVERASSAKPLHRLNVDRVTYDLLRRARESREARRDEEAVSLYRRALAQGGGYLAPANLELAHALAALSRTEEAVAAMLPVTEKEGERYPIAFYHLGRYYERLGQHGLSGEAFARAAALIGGDNPQVLTDLSRVREKEGKTREAYEAIEAYVRGMESRGGAPAWARARAATLKEKAAAGSTK
ncbi:MAG TPA: tetratricopeptide repeat protein [Pyrinomonadaceae bacterium]